MFTSHDLDTGEIKKTFDCVTNFTKINKNLFVINFIINYSYCKVHERDKNGINTLPFTSPQ